MTDSGDPDRSHGHGDSGHPNGTEYEYVAHRPEYFGEQTFESRHAAIGHAAICGRYTDDEWAVFARQKTREPMVNSALWRAKIIDQSGNEWEHVGWTLLYETRSFATEAAYRYMLMNHLDGVKVTSCPWYGEQYRQVGALESNGDQYPIYVGFEADGSPIEHDANQLQYADHVNRLSLNRFDRRAIESDADTTSTGGDCP